MDCTISNPMVSEKSHEMITKPRRLSVLFDLRRVCTGLIAGGCRALIVSLVGEGIVNTEDTGGWWNYLTNFVSIAKDWKTGNMIAWSLYALKTKRAVKDVENDNLNIRLSNQFVTHTPSMM